MGNCVAAPSVNLSHQIKESAHTSVSSLWRAHVRGSRYLLCEEHAADISDKYEVKQVLGWGAYATTRLCVEKATGRHFAVKAIRKKGLSHDERKRVRRELQVLHHLSGHPNIVRLADAYEDDNSVHLVMELCSGGEMLERIVSKGKYTERDAAEVMRSILEAVAYAHEMGCVHRDIKIENCLMLDASPCAPVKVVDWGYSTFLRPGEKLHKLCGTSTYLAPEVLEGCYDEKADIWSCGVVLFVMLAGRLPFVGKTQQEVMDLIRDEKTGVPDMTRPCWQSVSGPAKAAVLAMMTRDPDKRPSAWDMLQHDWIREHGAAGGDEMEPQVLHRIKSFAGMSKLKQHSAMVIAQHLPADQIRGLKLLFESIDKDHKGAITPDKLRKALEERCRAHLDAGELEHLVALADLHHGGSQLDFDEFVAAALHHTRLEEEDNMRVAFRHFDRDGDGCISAAELCAVLAEDCGKCGHKAQQPATEDEVASIIHAVDENGDGNIDWKEFVHMMHSDQAITMSCTGAANTALTRSSCGFYDLY